MLDSAVNKMDENPFYVDVEELGFWYDEADLEEMNLMEVF